ncbi:FecR domain-containing protein [Treponema parvum]|uniref:FecR domain-containing protein n=1 Tax=Treponema parvum TaxID=138851 RepID=A0A975F2L1_9SPIR|nr:FecR domain-containing protein [Treponema parvum]QTQ13233.1 FecR domain-containing protein [Treponema parvum]
MLKANFNAVFAVVLGIFFAGTAFAADTKAVPAAGKNTEGKVISATGKVQVKDGAAWKSLAAGDSIKKGDVISTGFKSEANIKFGNSVFVVEPLSRITIEQLAEKDGNEASQMFLDTGSVRANVRAAENKRVGFSVRSPVATASVRGTEGRVVSDGTVYSTKSTWAVWPTPPSQQQSSVVADAPEGEGGGDVMSSVSITPSDGVKAVAVGEGTSAEVSSAGTVTPPSQVAAAAAVSVGGSTTSASSGETKATTSSAGSSVGAALASSPAAPTKGGLNITVSVRE